MFLWGFILLTNYGDVAIKIFIVARGWPSKREPQLGCFERDQALALKSLGHQIVVLNVDVRLKLYIRKYGITKRTEKDVSIYNLYAGPFWGRLIKYISLTAFEKANRFLFLCLFKYVTKREGMPDLIYSHYLGNLEMALAAKWNYNIPIVGIEHFSFNMGWTDKFDYNKIMRYYYVLEDSWENVYPSLLPQWDRSPRSGVNGIYVNSTPENFKKSIHYALELIKDKQDEHKILFLKSWNEWAEGNNVEPDLKYGHGFLDAIRDTIV